MSRAFTKEPEGDQVQDDQPELPISKHANYVTTNGLQQLKDTREALLKKKGELVGDEESMSTKIVLAQIERELRYYKVRIQSVIVVSTRRLDKERVAIGATVTAMDENNKTYRFTIVGEDEAAIDEGKISWISPLASVLMGKKRGDRVLWRRPVGDLSVEVVEITYT